MLTLEGSAVLHGGLAGREGSAEQGLPLVRPAVADRLFGASALIGREVLGEGQRDDRPFAVFLLPAIIAAEARDYVGVSLRRQIEPAMAGRGVSDDAFGVDGRALGSAPVRAVP